MSNNEMIKMAKELMELKALAAELSNEISSLEDAFKAEMTERDEDQITAGNFTITWKEFTTVKFNSSLFKKQNEELARQYTTTSTSRRFVIK